MSSVQVEVEAAVVVLEMKMMLVCPFFVCLVVIGCDRLRMTQKMSLFRYLENFTKNDVNCVYLIKI